MRIGVVSDTHGLFDRALLRHFSGVDHILHAGDIGKRGVIEQLTQIAPVTAVSGNVDGFEASGFPVEQVLDLAGYRVALYHRLYEGGRLTRDGTGFLTRTHPAICVNPGSAGPKRFHLPRAVGLLVLDSGTIDARHIVLADRAE